MANPDPGHASLAARDGVWPLATCRAYAGLEQCAGAALADGPAPGLGLWNDTRNYDVQLNPQVREGRGLYGGYDIVRFDLLTGFSAEDGVYNRCKRERTVVRVQEGVLLTFDRGGRI